MNKEQAKELLPIITAFAEGKTIQVRGIGEWITTDTPDWNSCLSYRIKPTPTLRPWKPEEVPVGCLLKGIGYPYITILLGHNGTDIWYSDTKGVHTLEIVMVSKYYEHSLDHGKTWHPCGVMEE